MKIVIAPDSFKHTMSAREVCEAMRRGVLEVLPAAEVVCLPLGDGGEGTMEALTESTGGRSVRIEVCGSEFIPVASSCCITPDGTAVIEMASICGLMRTARPNPCETTTYGIGQAILSALDNGCGRILLCIGGSATNDAGIGALSALGVRFLDSIGQEVRPAGGYLGDICQIDAGGLDPRLGGCEILLACDVDNPLYGKNGAAYVYAPQKGATPAMVETLDAGLRHFAHLVAEATGKDIASIPGSGAAGGIGAGLAAYANVTFRSGIELALDTVGFDRAVEDADWIITGEGCTDSQTLRGKVPAGVVKRAAALGRRVLIISGSVDGNGDIDNALYDAGVAAVFPAVRLPKSFGEIKPYCSNWLQSTVRNVCRLIK